MLEKHKKWKLLKYSRINIDELVKSPTIFTSEI